jgi:translocation and assembly module TamA
MKLFRLKILLFSLFISTTLLSQEKISTTWLYTDGMPDRKLLKYQPNTKISDSAAVIREARNYVSYLHNNGYLEASIDSFIIEQGEADIKIYVGNQSEDVQLNISEVDEEIMTKSGYRDKFIARTQFSSAFVSRFFESIISYCENNGYPFARIRLDSVRVDVGEVNAMVLLDKGPLYRIDSIQIIREKVKLTDYYIQNVIAIRKGDLYSEVQLLRIDRNIQNNKYLTLLDPPEIIFSEKGKARLIVHVGGSRSSSFDGILGFQPQEESTEIVITGNIDLKLGNALGWGEDLNLNWQRLQDQTQQIKLGAGTPFLFRSPFGLRYNLDIYRQDTTFNNVEHKLGITYSLPSSSTFTGFVRWFSSDIIRPDALPGSNLNNSNSRALTYGIAFQHSALDYRFNPRKGYVLSAEFSVGENELIVDPLLAEQIGDSIALSSTQLEAKLDFHLFIPLGRQWTLLFRAHGASLQTDNLTSNQSYRIGGIHSIRGFDEQSILASSYGVGTTELRLLFEKDSYLTLFTDVGWYEQSYISSYDSDVPFGFGGGISFSTKAGIFSLFYALGSQRGNPVELRTGKIHFGFVNYF